MTASQWDILRRLQISGGQAWTNDLAKVVPPGASVHRLRNDLRALVDLKMTLFVRRRGVGADQVSLYQLTERGLAYCDERPAPRQRRSANQPDAVAVPEDYQPAPGDQLLKAGRVLEVTEIDEDVVTYIIGDHLELGAHRCPVRKFRVQMVGSGAKLRRMQA